MVFITNNFAFFGIHKNATKAITSALLEGECGDVYVNGPITKLGKNIYKNIEDFSKLFHTQYSYFIKDFNQYIPKNIFKFTFVRNPYSRFATSYKYSIQNKWCDDKITMLNFLKIVENGLKKTIDNMNPKEKMIVAHSIPQYKYCTINNEVCMDFVGKIETIEKDWIHIKNKLESLGVNGIPKNVMKRNVTKDKTHWRTILNSNKNVSEICDKVYKLYKLDFELFRYDRESYKL